LTGLETRDLNFAKVRQNCSLLQLLWQMKNPLRVTLSQTLHSGVFLRSVKAVPASRNDGLQVADMLARFVRNNPSAIKSSIVKLIHYPD